VAGGWDDGAAGVLALPSGRRVRGRAWRDLPAGPTPDLGVYLLGRAPEPPPWQSRWVRWRDFSLPADPAQLRAALTEAWERAAGERVEVACRGGTGRTGTALACLAVLDGVPPGEAVAFVRAGYGPRAVETRAQAAFVARFAG
jgi:protein-tyrosine phosphatase